MRTGGIYKGVTSTYTTSELDANGLSIKGMAIGCLHDRGGNTYKLIKATAAIGANALVEHTPGATTFGALGAAGAEADAATGDVLGVAETAIGSGDFGWVTVAGVAQCEVADSTAAGSQMTASGSAGVAQAGAFNDDTAQKSFGTLLTAGGSGVQVRPIQLQGLI